MRADEAPALADHMDRVVDLRTKTAESPVSHFQPLLHTSLPPHIRLVIETVVGAWDAGTEWEPLDAEERGGEADADPLEEFRREDINWGELER